MNLHALPKLQRKTKRRVARGGKRGTYSGRGVKGQRSRAGHRIRPAERDLIIRIPKRRGFRNKPLAPKAIAISLQDLAKKLQPAFEKDKSPVPFDRGVARQLRYVTPRDARAIKILGDGSIPFPLAVKKGVAVSRAARDKIEKAGGSIE